MKLMEVSQAAFDDKTKKNMDRVAKAVKKEMSRFGKFTMEVIPHNYLAGEIAVHFQHWMRPETIEDAYTEFKDAIKAADVNGHIAKIEDGNGHGAHFVEAILSGLRPGMPVKAEAFFPTLAYGITWKNIVSSKK